MCKEYNSVLSTPTQADNDISVKPKYWSIFTKNSTRMCNEQAVIEYAWHVISAVTCCHIVKLCLLATWAL